ncbi:probable phosphopantothenoylcysteine decarboxylase [Arachis duranensis]|uniref:phosphopantothenoylcysteine decarboxylase n=1 Tax=Arachis duranensis TaxID=130453 RepID=A0A6P5NPU0_ARADU|nr:probable phosphopantothenoylcysteine decarboxylase [Arachis duranensis]XP_020999762.1 probable phosphopantothenoylcysteine decarboxylase [Arachis duranensis]
MASSYIVRGKTYADAVLLPPVAPPKKKQILLAVCGCESAANFRQLIQAFLRWAEVKVIVTKSAKKFVKPPFPDEVLVYMDDDQWILWEKKVAVCLHAELYMWADAMVIAPLSVHALAKIAGGFCDTLLTSVVRAWNCVRKPLFVVPSMDPLWKENYTTLRSYISLHELGILIITLLIQKKDGKLPEPDEISKFVRDNIWCI